MPVTMNKRILVGIVVFVGLIGGGMAYLAMKPDGKTAEKAVSRTPSEGKQPKSQPGLTSVPAQSPAALPAPAMAQPGTFVDYSPAAFNNSSGSRIVFFHAPWCFQCRELEKDIKANLDKIPSGVTVFKIDYDSNQDLRQKYGVKLQTSFIKVDAGGKVIQNFVAYDEPTFANLDKNIF